MHPKGIYKGYKVARKILIGIQSNCSCYTCLPRTAPAAAQTELKTKTAPGTDTDASPVARRLLTNTWPKRGTTISIQANTNKNKETVHQYIKTTYKTSLRATTIAWT